MKVPCGPITAKPRSETVNEFQGLTPIRAFNAGACASPDARPAPTSSSKLGNANVGWAIQRQGMRNRRFQTRGFTVNPPRTARPHLPEAQDMPLCKCWTRRNIQTIEALDRDTPVVDEDRDPWLTRVR